MRLLECTLPCTSKPKNPQSPPNSLHLESSTTCSLSSQPSLPSVPSLSLQTPTTIHHQCVVSIKAHTSHVFSLTLSDKFLFSGSSNGEIKAWNIKHPFSLQTSTHSFVATCNGSAAVKSMVVDGGKLFSGHQDNKIRVWKIERSNDLIKDIRLITSLPTINDRILKLFSKKNYVEVRRHKKRTWVHHVDAVSGLALSEDHSVLYSASWDRTFKVWRTSDFRCLESVNAHEDAINAIVVSKDGTVYTGSADKKIKGWKKKSGEKRHTLVTTMEKHQSGINALALGNHGAVLYSGACDRSILVWEKDTSESENMMVVGALRGHTKAILCINVMSDLVFSGSADKTVRIWRRGFDGRYCCLGVLEGHKKAVKCLIAATTSSESDSDSSSALVCSGGLDCEIRIWSVQVPIS